ncbi:DUF6301 family protein [Nocardia fluminea]
MQADIEGAVRIARLARGFDWRWTYESAEEFSRVVGFHLGLPVDEVTPLQTGLRVDPPTGYLMRSRKFFSRHGISGQSVSELLVYVTDRGNALDPLLHSSLVDVLAELSTVFITEFGAPTRTRPGDDAEIGWDLPEVTILLAKLAAGIQLSFVNPIYQNWWDAQESIDAEAEDSDWDEPDPSRAESVDVSLDGPQTWRERRDSLVEAVTRLPNGVELVLNAVGGNGLAFKQTDLSLIAKISFGSGRRRENKYGDEWYENRGWAHEGDGHQAEWVRSIEWPARYSDYESLVDAAIVVLRHPLHVGHPTEVRVDVI